MMPHARTEQARFIRYDFGRGGSPAGPGEQTLRGPSATSLA
ncbi:hypothetical protein NSPZN2_11222 [Nitrospira defluvii]|uniref:Uncharacterized protein n=1 Tax=Nitrospira defluvii TaxID=330214 RepID=A0ABM8QRC8_9BACT|nr:hypothetical protein NSPZN2_11222 [Nitrospira defluvii]